MKKVFFKTVLIGLITFLAQGCSNDRLADDFISPPENFRTGASGLIFKEFKKFAFVRQ
jgi:hypothetical protein